MAPMSTDGLASSGGLHVPAQRLFRNTPAPSNLNQALCGHSTALLQDFGDCSSDHLGVAFRLFAFARHRHGTRKLPRSENEDSVAREKWWSWVCR